ncbi:MAG: hypothetical protein NWR21_08000 [Verrucomicrobiales bacterium]|jgi:hypothetical protein|nr:hypothetical protein [Verrucomicrobiales bacterium]MDP4939241.1 hypothetical protein [Verrucomicrobiales bacterium]MDP5007301.1 hypothetical protein [Verrucomicrobiales bacterium]
MNAATLLRIISFLVLCGSIAPVSAQVVPQNPNQFTKRKLGDNGGAGSSTGASAVTPQSRTVVVQHIAVTPVQAWVSANGKTMEARLLAFSAPEPGDAGPVEIIRDGKVRFLVTGRKEPVDFPLTGLDEKEQVKIKALAEVAAKGPPAQ